MGCGCPAHPETPLKLLQDSCHTSVLHGSTAAGHCPAAGLRITFLLQICCRTAVLQLPCGAFLPLWMCCMTAALDVSCKYPSSRTVLQQRAMQQQGHAGELQDGGRYTLCNQTEGRQRRKTETAIMTKRRRQSTRDQYEEHRPLQVSQADATEYFRTAAKAKTQITKVNLCVLRLLFPSGAAI